MASQDRPFLNGEFEGSIVEEGIFHSSRGEVDQSDIPGGRGEQGGSDRLLVYRSLGGPGIPPSARETLGRAWQLKIFAARFPENFSAAPKKQISYTSHMPRRRALR